MTKWKQISLLKTTYDYILSFFIRLNLENLKNLFMMIRGEKVITHDLYFIKVITHDLYYPELYFQLDL